MSKQRGSWPFVFYISILLITVAALWGTLQSGEHLVPGGSNPQSQETLSLTTAFSDFQSSVSEHVQSTIGLLLLQILIILVIARLMGWLFRKMHQPAVIGEIVAGIILGPSLLGRFFPDLFHAIFPPSSLPNIQLLSNFGLILFMFAIGMELRLGDIRRQFKQSIIISHIGIFIPFGLSLPLSYGIYTQYAAGYTSFTPFALFIGIAMSITAFPVLARIIQENKLSRTHLGKLSLSTAAAGDITAWLMLAAIIAISQSGSILSTGYNHHTRLGRGDLHPPPTLFICDGAPEHARSLRCIHLWASNARGSLLPKNHHGQGGGCITPPIPPALLRL